MKLNIHTDTPLVPQCACNQHFIDEILLGTDGRYLGCFDDVYKPSPFPTDLADPVWPVGFTPVGYLGQNAGENGEFNLLQWLHGTAVSCPEDSANSHFVPNFVNVLIGGGVVTDHIIAPNTHVTGHFTTEAASWPVAGQFAWIYSSSDIKVVVDNSGPPGLEDVNALEIDFSGMGGGEGVTFIGEGGGYTGAGPGGGYGWRQDETSHSTTGWHVDNDSCWTLDFWVKAVPDNDGFTCSGYNFNGHTGFYPDYASWSPITLDGTWQHFKDDLIWFPVGISDPMNNAILGIGTDNPNRHNCGEDIPGGHALQLAVRKGRVHVKCPQVYPCESSVGVHLKHRSRSGVL